MMPTLKYKWIPTEITEPMEIRTLEYDSEPYIAISDLISKDHPPVEQIRLGRFPGDLMVSAAGERQTVPNDGSLVMLVDEEGRLKVGTPLNIRASYLYGSQYHGQPIMGAALLVGLDDELDEQWVDYPLDN